MESFGHLCPVIVGLWVGEIGEHYISWPDLENRYFKDFLKLLSNVCVYKASHIFLTITCILHLILYLICELHYPANQWNSFAVFDPDVHLGSYIIGRIRGRTLLITNSWILKPYWREINKVIPINSPKVTFLIKLKKLQKTRAIRKLILNISTYHNHDVMHPHAM